MRLLALLCSLSLLVATLGWSKPAPDGFVLVEGGAFAHPQSNFHGKPVSVSSFLIGKYEVTQKEWVAVMDSNPSKFKGDDLPVDTVTWYDAIEYCNRRSEREGLQPYYRIDRQRRDPRNDGELDDLKWSVSINAGANGYRLPTEAEWEFAASGGRKSRGYVYSGHSDLDKVGWYWKNAGAEPLDGMWNWPMIERNRNQTHPVGRKAPNELGLHDMSGNVREWCWDWHADTLTAAGKDPQGAAGGSARVCKGGGWLGGDHACETAHRGSFEPNGLGADQGFRICRSP